MKQTQFCGAFYFVLFYFYTYFTNPCTSTLNHEYIFQNILNKW